MNEQYRRSYAIFLSRMLCCSRSSRAAQALPQGPLDRRVPIQTACNGAEVGQMTQYTQGNYGRRFTESHC